MNKTHNTMKLDCKKVTNKTAKLDLSTPIEERIAVPVGEFKITLKKIFGLFGTRPYGGKVILKLYSKTANAKIKQTEDCKLLTLKCDGKVGNELEINVEGKREFPLEVIFNPGSIEDCDDRSISEFIINYTIEYSCIPGSPMAKWIRKHFGKNESQSKTISEQATIGLSIIRVKPKLSPLECKFKYESREVTRVLRIQNSSILHYAPTACLQILGFQLFDSTGTQCYKDAVSLKMNKAALNPETQNYTPYGTPPIIIINQQPQIVDDNNEIKIVYPHLGYWIDIPFTIDLTRLPSPLERDTYCITVEYNHWNDKDTDKTNKLERFDLVIERNEEHIDLDMSLKLALAGEYRIKEVLSHDVDVKDTVWVNREEATDYLIAINNRATIRQQDCPNAGIVIRNFVCNGIAFKNGLVAKDNNGGIISINSLCNCRPLSFQEKRLLPREAGVTIKIPFDFRQTFIEHFWDDKNKKKYYDAKAEVHFSFDYFIDTTGNSDLKAAHFEHVDRRVVFKLSIEPRSEWLGVDFGTSAVVALYGNGMDEQGMPVDCIQNLKKIKQNGLNSVYTKQTEGRKRTITDEDVFINSKIVLGDDYPNGLEVTDFSKYKQGNILFSPGDEFTYKNLLPSLKSMMGYEKIQRPNGGKASVKVDDIYAQAYGQLFKLYLNHVSQGQRIEKLVMTYPNTFSTEHVKQLKKLAQQNLPSLREGYVVPVSESDAVAYRYLMCFPSYLRRMGNNAGGDLFRNVLIYDMGAGTLDITYINNEVKNEQRIVDIKGKFGLSKAGNYFDYVLAEIVVDICNDNKFTDVNGNGFKDYLLNKDNRIGVDIETASKLKNYVKDKLKPLLADIESDAQAIQTMMPQWDNLGGDYSLETVAMSKVFQHKKFKQFINEISEEVIEICDNLFPCKLNQVHAVVFSGRMTSIKAIKNAVMIAVRKKASGVCSIDIAEMEAEGDGLQLRKTAVVKGAFDYVNYIKDGNRIVLSPPKPFYANYCVVVKQLTRDRGVEYDVSNIVHNLTPGYRSEKDIDLTNVSALYLVQTYAVGKEAIIKDFNGDRNLTTLLDVRKTTELKGSFPVIVRVNCQEDGNQLEQGTKEVELNVGGAHNEILPHENMFSNAFRKSAWPIVF